MAFEEKIKELKTRYPKWESETLIMPRNPQARKKIKERAETLRQELDKALAEKRERAQKISSQEEINRMADLEILSESLLYRMRVLANLLNGGSAKFKELEGEQRTLGLGENEHDDSGQKRRKELFMKEKEFVDKLF